MFSLGSEVALDWLAATVIFWIFFGLLKMGVAVSKMTIDKQGKFQMISRIVIPFRVKYSNHRIDQALYEKLLTLLSYPVAALGIFTFIGFLLSAI
ncbi:hypothetical protein GN278_11105 [Rhodobacteraceae bacterium Araon29]